ISGGVTANGPLVYNHKFTSSVIGRDLWLKIGTAADSTTAGNTGFELYEYHPIVEQEFPEQVAFYENRPIEQSQTRRRFGGISLDIDTLGNSITVTPVIDGVDSSQTFTVSTTSGIPVTQNLTFTTTEVIGRDLWVRLT